MNHQQTPSGTPWHLWVVGGLLFLFNGMGAASYIATLTRFEPMLAGQSQDVLDYYFNVPAWMMLMWGVSTVGGFLGAVLLLMRRKIAVSVMAAAWVCSVVVVAYTTAFPPPGGGSITFPIIVLIVALVLLFYMIWLSRGGVLR